MWRLCKPLLQDGLKESKKRTHLLSIECDYVSDFILSCHLLYRRFHSVPISWCPWHLAKIVELSCSFFGILFSVFSALLSIRKNGGKTDNSDRSMPGDALGRSPQEWRESVGQVESETGAQYRNRFVDVVLQ